MSKEIKLTKGYYAIVDDDDYEQVAKYKWAAMENHKTNVVYAYRGYKKADGKRSTMYLHRLIMNPKKGGMVDHINHNGLDCRRKNMRVCNLSENIQNSRKYRGSTSKFRGVYRSKNRKKWTASITINRKTIYLGSYKKEVDAAKKYDEAAKKLKSKFVTLNFPDT